MSTERTDRMLEICLLGGCMIRCGDGHTEELPQKSKKGAALLTYLILHRGRPIPASRIIRELWSHRRITNPENALKTLGGAVERVQSLAIPGRDWDHRAVWIAKVAPTPEKYPRRAGMAEKKPL